MLLLGPLFFSLGVKAMPPPNSGRCWGSPEFSAPPISASYRKLMGSSQYFLMTSSNERIPELIITKPVAAPSTLSLLQSAILFAVRASNCGQKPYVKCKNHGSRGSLALNEQCKLENQGVFLRRSPVLPFEAGYPPLQNPRSQQQAAPPAHTWYTSPDVSHGRERSYHPCPSAASGGVLLVRGVCLNPTPAQAAAGSDLQRCTCIAVSPCNAIGKYYPILPSFLIC